MNRHPQDPALGISTMHQTITFHGHSMYEKDLQWNSETRNQLASMPCKYNNQIQQYKPQHMHYNAHKHSHRERVGQDDEIKTRNFL